MDGRTEIRAKLLLDSTVTDLVGTYETLPAIFDAPITPDKYTDAAISIYQSGTFGGVGFKQIGNSVNCWAKTYKIAEALQDAVYNALFRDNDKTIGFVPAKLGIIPPQETGGDYNAPVEVLTKIALGG